MISPLTSGRRHAASKVHLPKVPGLSATAMELPRAKLAALIAYSALSGFSAAIGLANGRSLGLAAVALVPIALGLRRRPLAFALTLLLGGIILRLTFLGVLDADGLAISQSALTTVLGGGNPYGHGYAVSVPPGSPFVYGPLALVTSIPGVWVELAAGIVTMALMAYLRCWIALSIYAAAPLVATMTMSGINDVLPGLLIAAGLLAFRWKPAAGAVLLALAAGIKPYAFAWFPAAVAMGGLDGLLSLSLVTAVVWAPLLWWGVGTYLQSVGLARDVHTVGLDALDLPQLRILGVIPFVASFFSRSWQASVLLGTAVFVLVLFLDRWASVGYWLALAPILLIAGDQAVSHKLRARGDGSMSPIANP